ncbi:MAG: fasciclin domain-containing protein [Candidatus Obscuribacterales bacterium]|nr:fasciclin domain-containing protein [Candidatus Obscuribacterales bacterium]
MQTLKKDIVDSAVAAGSFNTLVAAVTAAGLADTLRGAGPFTVFAPSDEAFKKVPEAALQALLADKDKLTKVLTLHVVAQKLLAKDVQNLTTAKTVEGTPLSIKLEGGTVTVHGAKVTATDIECSNGVIHVIDTVILPNN